MPMERYRDFFVRGINCLNQSNIDYVIVGGALMPYYGNLRSTQDIDIMLLVSEESMPKIVDLERCLTNQDIEFSAKDFEIHGMSGVQVNAFDSKSWIYRLDLKKITSEVDRLTYNYRKKLEIHGIDVFASCPESLIAIKISDGFRSNTDLEDILAIISRERIEIPLLRKFLTSVNAQDAFEQLLESRDCPSCRAILEQLRR